LIAAGLQDILQRMKAALDQCHRSLSAHSRDAMPFGDTQKFQRICGHSPPHPACKKINLIANPLRTSNLRNREYQMNTVYDPGDIA